MIAIVLVGARPYEDTQKRFRLDVAEAWSLAPQFGDTSGMVFERKVPEREGGGSALFIVRADPSGGRALGDYVSQIEGSFAAMPDFRAGTSRAVEVAGRGATQKRYRTRGRRLTSTFVEANGFFYLLHFEAPRRAARRLWPQAQAMLGSFRPGRVQARSPVATTTARAPEVEAPVGRWQSKSGLVLLLEEGGRYELADVSGTYRIDGGQLVLSRPGGGRQTFGFTHDDDRLVLTSPDLSSPIEYRRAAAPRPPSTEKLFGRWRSVKTDPPFELKIDPAGTFVLGPYSGKWSVDGSALRLEKTDVEFVTYDFRFAKKRLVLSGGDLDAPVSFRRLR